MGSCGDKTTSGKTCKSPTFSFHYWWNKFPYLPRLGMALQLRAGFFQYHDPVTVTPSSRHSWCFPSARFKRPMSCLYGLLADLYSCFFPQQWSCCGFSSVVPRGTKSGTPAASSTALSSSLPLDGGAFSSAGLCIFISIEVLYPHYL